MENNAKIGVFDIETYKRYFCFVGKVYNETEKKCISTTKVFSVDGKLSSTEFKKIEAWFDSVDYCVSYNGSRFDLPVLARVKGSIHRLTSYPSSYIHDDATLLMSYDANNNPVKKHHPTVKEWSVKHFDLLNCCLLNKSLKQWEMYEELKIKTLPYDPTSNVLTYEQCDEILDYCEYDVEATAELFWRMGYDHCHIIGKPAFKAYQLLFDRLPKEMQYRFDRPTASYAAAILYRQNTPIPPKTLNPFDLFDLNSFDVPTQLKVLIAQIASGGLTKEDGWEWNGITYGKGGAHFVVPGLHEDIYEFDVASLYPNIINKWGLLKTPEATERYRAIMVERLEAKKDIMGFRNQALKLILNAYTGSLRLRSGFNVAYDNAAGEALCYIGQLIITELALASPREALIEINTDSVFVKGEEAAKILRQKATELTEKYGIDTKINRPFIIFEEEHVEKLYFRDVNNYVVYKNDIVVKGKGDDWSDLKAKKSNRAVYAELFHNIIRKTLENKWQERKDEDWKQFIVKYHKSAASKYASIGGQPMTKKDYFFMWTTRECPGATTISFTRDLINSKNGSIKPRYGVYAWDVAELEKSTPFLDFNQYQMDLDDALELWGRSDLTTTRIPKAVRKTKNLNDIIPGVF